MNIGLSLPSQRVDRFDENIAALSGGLRKSGLTFAVEAGTQRLRDVVNKDLTYAQLEAGVRTAVAAGWRQVKLYFMMGLPSETDDDVLAIADTIRALQRAVRLPNRQRLAVHVTVSALIPKPHTPFQWHNVSSEELDRKRGLVIKSFSRMRDVKLMVASWRIHSLEDFLSRGDRRASAVVLRARELGVGADAWWTDEKGAHATWVQAIADCGLSPQYRAMEAGSWDIMNPTIMPQEVVRGKRGWYDFAKAKGVDFKTLNPKGAAATKDGGVAAAAVTAAVSEAAAGGAAAAVEEGGSLLDRPLPWDHIDTGVEKGWLRDELMRALTGTLTPRLAPSPSAPSAACAAVSGAIMSCPEPPPIPAFEGNWRPDTTKANTLRLSLAKRGDASLLSHLDTFRLFDRALRRSRLPISFSGGFHPKPRISAASALPFGATADAELFDLTLTSYVSAADFTAAFAPQLTPGFSVVAVEELDDKAATVAHRMRAAEYVVGVYLAADGEALVDGTGDAAADAPVPAVAVDAGMAAAQSTPAASASMTVAVDTQADAASAAAAAAPATRPEDIDWPALVADTLAMDACAVTRATNGGKGQNTRTIDLRSRLFDLRLAEPADAAPVLHHVGPADWPAGAVALTATVLCSNDGALSPDDLVELLRVAAGGRLPGLELLHAHRRGLLLASEEEVAATAAVAKAATRARRKEREVAAEVAADAKAARKAAGAAAAAARAEAVNEATARGARLPVARRVGWRLLETGDACNSGATAGAGGDADVWLLLLWGASPAWSRGCAAAEW
eukprot:TRINITY_DN7141_c0_g1_i1.p1 TRINITY_DN7141_c0_g1~~TRINITY_DN7141_c0_g1_i1.p1  ORF type:complete len:840 (-),score=345.65 TRINITY_DN7141_c0_g1_i1:328-2694(-)